MDYDTQTSTSNNNRQVSSSNWNQIQMASRYYSKHGLSSHVTYKKTSTSKHTWNSYVFHWASATLPQHGKVKRVQIRTVILQMHVSTRVPSWWSRCMNHASFNSWKPRNFGTSIRSNEFTFCSSSNTKTLVEYLTSWRSLAFVYHRQATLYFYYRRLKQSTFWKKSMIFSSLDTIKLFVKSCNNSKFLHFDGPWWILTLSGSQN